MPKAAANTTTLPGLALQVDPIFAALAAHVAANAEFDRQIALAQAGRIGDDWSAIQAARVRAALVSAERAEKAIVETAPTTRDGLRALSDHLRRHVVP
jgi:hypothetical protein